MAKRPPRKAGVKKRVMGRPTIFTQKLADQICELLSRGLSLRTVLLREGMPAGETVFRWLRTDKEFQEQYARAKEEASDALAEEILDISDDSPGVVKKGKASKASALIQAQRLRVDTRKWIMAKMKPKKYGEKLDVTTDNRPINFVLPGEIKKKHGIPSHAGKGSRG